MVKHTAADDTAANDQHPDVALHRVRFPAIACNQLLRRRDTVTRLSAYLPAAHRPGVGRFLVARRLLLGDPRRARRGPPVSRVAPAGKVIRCGAAAREPAAAGAAPATRCADVDILPFSPHHARAPGAGAATDRRRDRSAERRLYE